MTWHKVTLQPPKPDKNGRVYIWDFLHPLNQWCDHNLSSHGVLWKNGPDEEWNVFYFAQPQDAVMFRLVNGV